MNLLRSDITVQALIRRATSNGAFAVVRKHGDDDAGSVLVMVSTMDGLATLYGPTRDENFNRVWERLCPVASPEAEIEKTLAKRLQFDPDIWVIEIEDRQGRHFLAETVMD